MLKLDEEKRRFVEAIGNLACAIKNVIISSSRALKLTSVLRRLVAHSGKMNTYSGAIEAILSKSVTLSPELLGDVERFIKDNFAVGLHH